MATLARKDAYADFPVKKVSLYFITLGFIALSIGTLFGPFQALNYANINLYPWLQKILPFVKSYYQGLTLHGVLNAIVFTQLFAQGALLYLQAKEMKMLPQMGVAWAAWWLAFVGLVMAAIPLLMDDATVLYTFYPPLKGHPLFYIGAALIIVSSLLSVYLAAELWYRWKKQNPDKPTPLVSYMSVVTWMMWGVAAIGLVVEAVVLLIPWSLGLLKGVDPLLARTLFWWTGHPIVYFWLLPAYVVWYGLLPRRTGGKLISDPLARLVFLAFLIFSSPVGFHHQFADPGIDPFWKLVHTVLTMMVAVPSLVTAFTVAASLELGAREAGGRGVFGWIKKLNWKDPIVLASTLGAISFIAGGAGGIVNASFTLDYVVHNTTWIPGHFHLPVATAVTLTHMGLAAVLIPHLTGKPLVGLGYFRAGVVLWFTGMMLMAIGMHTMGLQGVPRRAWIANMAPNLEGIYASSAIWMVLNGVAGTILLIAATLIFYSLFATLLQGKRLSPEERPEIEFTEAISGPEGRRSVMVMDRLFFWWATALVIVLVVYMPTLIRIWSTFVSAPGFRLW